MVLSKRKKSDVFFAFFLIAVGIASAQTSAPGTPSPAQQPHADASSAQAGDTNLRIALTFDDLPAHGSLPPGETRLEVASKVIAALHDARVPPTYGFVNGAAAEGQPDNVAVLQAWRAAGYPLGNHSWSHMNLNQHTLEEFEADVNRDEPLLGELMKNDDKGGEVQKAGEVQKDSWHWFRFPFLAEGDTPEKNAAIRAFLAQRGYKVAAVTMSFGDYMWNEPYARCKAKGDEKAIASLADSYLAAADDSMTYSRAMSHTLYGRDIPYVLLMHIGAFDAEMLPRLLNLYRSKGVQFVSLEEAERDEFYRIDTDLRQPPGPTSLEGMTWARHLTPPAHAVPAPQLDGLCR
jgi:peptidoglycan/xylan/chitin deacetylase (PgdA/CDA1 family)